MPRPERLPIAAHVGRQRSRVPVRGADPHRRDAPRRGGRHRRALEIQGRASRRQSRRAVLHLAAPAARVPAGGPRPAGVPAEPEDRALSRRGLHLHAGGGGEGAAARRDARSTSPTRSTPTSATSASARGSTARWCRSARGSATATSCRLITTPGHHPSRDWLNFVVTSRARNKIKHYIHAEEKARSLELGRKVFEKEARRYGLNLKSLTEGPAVRHGAHRVRLSEGRGALHRARLRQAGGEERAGQAGAAGAAEGSAGERARQVASASAACSVRPKTRSRSAASTT